jgi:hypothetical protein
MSISIRHPLNRKWTIFSLFTRASSLKTSTLQLLKNEEFFLFVFFFPTPSLLSWLLNTKQMLVMLGSNVINIKGQHENSKFSGIHHRAIKVKC